MTYKTIREEELKDKVGADWFKAFDITEILGNIDFTKIWNCKVADYNFQGRNDKGRMNSKSDDTTYMELISNLREALSILADAIKPKVYEYGFLKV
jgi:hypothetical protein